MLKALTITEARPGASAPRPLAHWRRIAAVAVWVRLDSTPAGGGTGTAAEDGGSSSSGSCGIGAPRPAPSPTMLTAITVSAPSALATVMGMGLTMAPSNSQRPPMRTGSNTPGRA